MFDLLSAYLTTLATPEQREEILDACQALVDAGQTAHQFAIEQEIGLAEVVDHDFLMSIHQRVLVPVFNDTFAQFGVVVSEEATVSQLTDILRALDGLDNYDDAETVIGLTQAEGDACDVLAEILPLTGRYPVEHYLQLIMHVNPGLLSALERMYTDQAAVRDASPMDHSAIVARVKRFLELSAVQVRAGSLVEAAVADGARLGAPMAELVEPYLERLDGMDGESLGCELVGLALASSTADAHLRSVIKQIIEQLPLDIPGAARADVSVGKLLKQVFPDA